MKILRRMLLGLAVLLVLFAVLVWFLPAAWLRPQIEARLHGLSLAGIGGSIWNGHAEHVMLANGTELGRLDWQLSRMTLLNKPALGFQLTGPQLDFRGQLEPQGKDRTHLHDVQLRADLGGLPIDTGWGQPRGELTATIPDAVLQASWPESMELRAQWRDAAMVTAQGQVALGGLQANLAAQQSVLQAELLNTQGSPLQVRGQATASIVSWRYSLEARSRQPEVRAWLARLGPLDADGTLHREGRGGLAAMTTEGSP